MTAGGFDSATRISAGKALTAEDIQAAGLSATEDVARYALPVSYTHLDVYKRQRYDLLTLVEKNYAG